MSNLVQDRPGADQVAAAKDGFRSILVHVQGGAPGRARLAAAANLASALDAKLIGVGAEMIQAALFSDPMGIASAQWIEEAVHQVQRDLDAAEKAFHVAAPGLQTEWLRIETFPVEAVVACSRAADLIVAGGARPAAADGYHWCDPAELAIKSGRPVLVVPESGGPLQGRRILVAWKDTRESRRAVADALPFLKTAEEVLVVEVSEHDNLGEARMHTIGVVENLKRHGVKARAKAVVALPIETAEVLIAEADQFDAGLVVSGAYGHSRLGEWAFGGVTLELLKWKGRYRLISH